MALVYTKTLEHSSLIYQEIIPSPSVFWNVKRKKYFQSAGVDHIICQVRGTSADVLHASCGLECHSQVVLHTDISADE